MQSHLKKLVYSVSAVICLLMVYSILATVIDRSYSLELKTFHLSPAYYEKLVHLDAKGRPNFKECEKLEANLKASYENTGLADYQWALVALYTAMKESPAVIAFATAEAKSNPRRGKILQEYSLSVKNKTGARNGFERFSLDSDSGAILEAIEFSVDPFRRMVSVKRSLTITSATASGFSFFVRSEVDVASIVVKSDATSFKSSVESLWKRQARVLVSWKNSRDSLGKKVSIMYSFYAKPTFDADIATGRIQLQDGGSSNAVSKNFFVRLDIERSANYRVVQYNYALSGTSSGLGVESFALRYDPFSFTFENREFEGVRVYAEIVPKDGPYVLLLFFSGIPFTVWILISVYLNVGKARGLGGFFFMGIALHLIYPALHNSVFINFFGFSLYPEYSTIFSLLGGASDTFLLILLCIQAVFAVRRAIFFHQKSSLGRGQYGDIELSLIALIAANIIILLNAFLIYLSAPYAEGLLLPVGVTSIATLADLLCLSRYRSVSLYSLVGKVVILSLFILACVRVFYSIGGKMGAFLFLLLAFAVSFLMATASSARMILGWKRDATGGMMRGIAIRTLEWLLSFDFSVGGERGPVVAILGFVISSLVLTYVSGFSALLSVVCSFFLSLLIVYIQKMIEI